MPERDVIAAVTSSPAKILGIQAEIGSLAIGTCADLTVLRNIPGAVLADCEGNERSGLRWQSVLTIRAGLPGTVGAT
jgi:predicted amidohydrolase